MQNIISRCLIDVASGVREFSSYKQDYEVRQEKLSKNSVMSFIVNV